ncbi:T cell receptor alpha variable 20 [Triplophysa dalaica]|uniref:T cell receptor alpha variable 20 n=1 Tax=Triplophysa dalaica TaxID=1582913 RepID=UPI0024DF41D2|nr:T cell receptor alpha variable 20 [Triplophysa dalaica]
MSIISFVLIFTFSYCEANVNPIRPDNSSVFITEGHNITLSCKYDGSAISLHWYRQTSGSTPEFLVLIIEFSQTVIPATPPQAHMSIRLHDKQVYLEISSVKVTDSALYYCALQPTVTQNTTTLYKNHIYS